MYTQVAIQHFYEYFSIQSQTQSTRTYDKKKENNNLLPGVYMLSKNSPTRDAKNKLFMNYT